VQIKEMEKSDEKSLQTFYSELTGRKDKEVNGCNIKEENCI
jgi:hypothetical protein